jgi:acylphosphatase
VFFRASAREQAARLGLVGMVRNLRTGQVELVAEGPREALERLVEWSRRGPPGAEVSGVEVLWGPASGGFSDFRVERTA